MTRSVLARQVGIDRRPVSHRISGFRGRPAVLLFLGMLLVFYAVFPQEKREKKEESQQPRITEEILVVGRAPGEAPLASVSRMEARDIDSLKPRDLGQVLALAAGANLSIGQKNETILLLRGMDARRIVLLLDGVPVYEPYFGTFDLKTVTAGDISSIQVMAGPASVLYGPNALAGLVNVVTHRPGDGPRLDFGGSYGENRTSGADLNGAFRWGRWAASGSALYQESAGFRLPAEEGERELRRLSDYRRASFNAKIFYYPADNSEILVSGNLYRSSYGVPPALEVQRPRYWRFKSWDRSSFSAGGFIGLGGRSLLRFRAYAVAYDNILEQYADPALETLLAESIFDNSVLGFFGLADLGLSRTHGLKVSLNLQSDRAKTRDGADLPWQNFRQILASLGAEHHIRLSEKTTVLTGLSFDGLDKFIGPTSFQINPMAGLRFRRLAGMEFNLSAAKKSRFPSMRSLYSSNTGNPDLQGEDGYALQLGGRFERLANLEFTLFNTSFRNMIDSIRRPDGTRLFVNVGRAFIRGLEFRVQENFSWMSASASYTYLTHRNQTDDRPLDTLPRHTLRAYVALEPAESFRLTLSGAAASSSSWFDASRGRALRVPAYAYLDAVITYGKPGWEAYLKATNILDADLCTEPGFPWPGRTLEAGFRISVFR